MNIFVLDTNPKKAAEYHCDKHVIKMILETAQLLCGACWMSGREAPYKLTHKNHPCAIWAREAVTNWAWLNDLGLRLCEEYTKRYKKVHKCESIIKNLEGPWLPSKARTPFPQAMPEQYRDPNPVTAYRNYYIYEKAYMARWDKLNNTPWWFKGSTEEG